MTAANFETPALAFTLHYEGGKADDPRDPGGRTNRGVTQATYASYRKAAGLPAADVFAMSDAELQAIYRIGFWDAVDGASLPAGVDLACFDFAVNSGPVRARSALQRAGGVAGAFKDPAATVKAVCAARLSFLHALATFRTFGRGWTARVAACEALGVKMAEHARTGVPVSAPATAGAAVRLQAEGRTAAAKGVAHKRKAAGALAIAAAGAATQVPAMHVPLMPVAVVGAAAVAAAVLLVWRASQHVTRARAFESVAREAVVPPPTTAAAPAIAA